MLIFLIIVALFGLIPALIAKKTGRKFGPWWVYGMVAWPVALVHVLTARRPSEGGTTTFGLVMASIFGAASGLIFVMVFIALLIADDDAKKFLTATGESEQVDEQRAQQEAAEDDELPSDMCGMTEAQRRSIWEERVRIERQARWYADSASPIIMKGQVLNLLDDAESIGKNTEVCERRKQELETILTEQYKLSPDQLDSISIESFVRSWPLPPVEAETVTAQQPESPFDPSAIIGRLQKPLICEEAKQLQWQRHDLGNGTERWLGSTPGNELLFEITPDYLYVQGSVSAPLSAANTLLAFCELNSLAFPEDYKSVNEKVVTKIASQAEAGDDSEFSKEVDGWLLEMQPFPSLGTISYKVSKAEKK